MATTTADPHVLASRPAPATTTATTPSPPPRPNDEPTSPPGHTNASPVATTNTTAVSTSPRNVSSVATTSNSSTSSRSSWKDSLTFSHGLGTTALIVAIIFGIGAWVGMKVQISQGSQNMDLAIWTACADHEAIQNTTLCKSILSKDFSQFAERSEDVKARDYKGELVPVDTDAALAKRDVDSEHLTAEPTKKIIPVSPIEKAIKKLSPYDKAMVNPQTDYSDMRNSPEPAIRVMVFPLVDLLVKPLSWIFDFIESMLLLFIYCIHRVFRWLTTVVVFCLQSWMYAVVEGLFKSVLAGLDQAILLIMPKFVPVIFVSDLATVLSITALRAYWYKVSYFRSLKWIVLIRLLIWSTAMFFQSIPAIIAFIKSAQRPNTLSTDRSWWRSVRGADSEPAFPTSSQMTPNPNFRLTAPSQEPINFNTSTSTYTPMQAKPQVLAPPPRRGRSPSPQVNADGRLPDQFDWPTSSSSTREVEESAEETFYKNLNVVNRRRHASART